LSGDKHERGMVASDMDGTMFRNDLGVLAFVHNLSRPDAWVMKPPLFRKLLLPKAYRSILNLGARGFMKDYLAVSDCELFLDLVEDVDELYKAIYMSTEKLSIDHPLVNEFARKMYEIDRLVLKMDHIFQEGSDGQLLMRTRFFVDKRPVAIENITSEMMAAYNNGDRSQALGIHDENSDVSEQRVKTDRVPDFDYDKKVVVVRDVRDMIMGLFGDGMPVRVVTTNLKTIAMGVLAASEYSDLLQQDCDGKRPVIASTLEEDEYTTLGPKPDKPPVFGPIKEGILEELQTKMRRDVICVFGDSFSNDTPMMRLAMRNGGIAVAVVKDYKSGRATFKPFVDKMRHELKDPDVGKRMFYAEDKD